MTTTLTDLLTPRTRATLEAMLMAVLQEQPIEGMPGVKFPVTDWLPGSFERTHMKMFATGLLDFEETIKFLTASGFLGLASSLVDADGNPVEGWMELLAAQNFGRIRNESGYARQLLTLSCTAGPGPYERAAGELIAYSPATGNRYLNVDTVAIPDGGSVTAIFQAEGPGGDYLDAAGTIIALVTPLPGVTVTNAATPAGMPSTYITGSGSIRVTTTAITTSPRTVKFTCVTAGRMDDHSAWFACTVYQGTSVVISAPFAAEATYSQDDLDFAIVDGQAGTQSFNVGDVWLVGAPGTPLLQAGTDKEPLDTLAKRCTDRFPEQSNTPTGNRYEGMVRAFEAANHLGITKVTTRPSDTVAGVEDVYIAGPTSTATPTQVAAVQSDLDQHSDQIGAANVIAAEAFPVSLGGVVKCRRGTLDTVKTSSNTEWRKYIAGLDIGGEDPDGLVKLAKLNEILIDAGAYNTGSLTLNGSAADIVLQSLQCATIAASDGLPSLGLTWYEVA